ncbi:MAG: hypothetical protein KDA58_16640, partial [Planctomycetaceae bacterium]|nr:hypothetical protein [Planctomycetaceae bacterium]
GIDAMRYRDRSGDLRIRPLQDINARYTMGRIALNWAHRFGQPGRWVHMEAQPSPQGIATTPAHVGGQPVRRRTWWVAHS